MRDVTMQELSDSGLNPFAVKLLLESWKQHPQPKAVAFRLGGIAFAVGYDPHALLEEVERLKKRLEPLQAEIDRLKKLLDRDHTGLASALVSVRKAVGSYFWIPLGEWGSYEEHERTEKALRQEVGRCFDEIDKTAETALRESGTRSGAAFVPERDQLAAAHHRIALLRAAVDLFYDGDGAEHEEGCPEDGNCRCPNIVLINEAMKE